MAEVVKKKRVLIVSQYFYPESFRINELAYELVKKDYHVDVLTSIPNYPEGKYYKGYGLFHKRKEVYNGVTIYRAFQTPRGKAGNVAMSFTYLTFLFCATLRVLFQFVFKKRYDAIIGFQMSPVTQVIPACILGRLTHTKVLTWVQDIWPDSIMDNVGEKGSRVLIPVLNGLTEYVYRNSDYLLISSRMMTKMICRYHDYSSKIEYVPNWCDDFRLIKKNEPVNMPDGFNIVMAGNLNAGLGLEGIVGLVEELQDCKDINFVFIGGGARKDYLEDYFKTHGLNNAYVLGRFPYEMMPSFYSKADAMLLTLAKARSLHLDVTVPSRLQSYMSAGKPVFAMIGSGAREVIETTESGFVVEEEDYKSLARFIRDNYKNRELLDRMGHNARTAFEKDFTLLAGVNHFEKLIVE